MQELLKRLFAGWESIGEYTGGQWDIRGASEDLLATLDGMERNRPAIWADAAVRGRRITVKGQHFNYRITPTRSEGLRLVIERKTKILG